MLRIGQVTVSGGSASSLCQVPAGPCVVILSSDPASAATAYVGVTPSGGSLTSLNGIPLASGASLTFPGYAAAVGVSLSVIAAGTASATVGWLVSRG